MSQRVTGTGFATVLARLGVRGPVEPFDLVPVVIPVSLVDLDVPLTVSTPVLAGASTEGELLAPAAAALLADSGAQAAGNYYAVVLIAHDGAAATAETYRLQRRDSANAANIWGQYLSMMGNSSPWLAFAFRVRLDQGERLRVIKGSVSNAGVTHQATIWVVVT